MLLSRAAWPGCLPFASKLTQVSRIASTASDTQLYTAGKEWCSFSKDATESVTVLLGISEEGLDEFGEPTKITCVAQAGQQLEKGDKLLDIHWEGYQRTASDELYHAVWDVVEGKRALKLPFAAQVCSYNAAILRDPGNLLCADTVRADVFCICADNGVLQLDGSMDRWNEIAHAPCWQEQENWLVKLRMPGSSAALLQKELLCRTSYLEMIDRGQLDES
mmetsp:Transcript_7692/g.19548  ORF Transcript_7692/g.19548 Transcript_7692/m.19548 type:complete len:220 (-) Transcript_7692:723-1382(-)